MPSQTNEQALEAAIEKRLTGTCLEELRTQGTLGDVTERTELYRAGNSYYLGLLWEEVFSRQSVANIIQHFVRFDGKESDPLGKKTLFFPRYHQMDVDLSTYGLERVKLNTTIDLDATKTEVDPQNPNPRGAHGGTEEKDPLDLIIRSFNERWFQGWDATPDEQRVKFVNIAQKLRSHPDFKKKYADNPDSQNADIAFRQMFDEVMSKERKNELDLYRLIAKDDAFRVAMLETLKRVLGAG